MDRVTDKKFSTRKYTWVLKSLALNTILIAANVIYVFDAYGIGQREKRIIVAAEHNLGQQNWSSCSQNVKIFVQEKQTISAQIYQQIRMVCIFT